MRLLLLAAVAIAAPALAAPPPAHHPADAQWADSLPGPDEIDDAARAADRAADAIMDVRVGPLLDAIDPGTNGPGHGDATIGDFARRDDPDIDRKVHESVGRLSASMSVLMARLAVLGPELERSFEELERSLDRATRGLPHRNDY